MDENAINSMVDVAMRSKAEELRETERQRIAAWLLGEAIKVAREGNLAMSERIRELALNVKMNAIEMNKGGAA